MNVKKLEDIVGKDWVITKREQMEDYLADETAKGVPFLAPSGASFPQRGNKCSRICFIIHLKR
jgi:hypothetical protein